jgi:hypothetical protein
MGMALCCVYIKHNLNSFYKQHILKIFQIKMKSFLEKNDDKINFVLGNVSKLANVKKF